jgi:hypothetical protein
MFIVKYICYFNSADQTNEFQYSHFQENLVASLVNGSGKKKVLDDQHG